MDMSFWECCAFGTEFLSPLRLLMTDLGVSVCPTKTRIRPEFEPNPVSDCDTLLTINKVSGAVLRR
jgi:hypothetical protein